MIISPVAALCFGSEVFFPVAVTSAIGGLICLIFRALSTQMFVGQVTSELVRDLVSAEIDRRKLVLSELTAAERRLFLSKIARIEAEVLLAKKDRSFSKRLVTPSSEILAPVLPANVTS
jgi:hypothetical protein